MPDLLQSGAEWLASKMKHHAAQDITYSRKNSIGVISSVELRAMRGRGILDLAGDQGGSFQVLSDDWTFTATDLELDGNVVSPQEGDRITHETATTRFTYEVMSPPFDPSENGVRIRAHTKLVKTEAL